MSSIERKFDPCTLNLMSDPSPEIAKLISERDESYRQMYAYLKAAEDMRKRAESADNQLRRLCNHVWERDYGGCFDDIYKHVCKVCGVHG